MRLTLIAAQSLDGFITLHDKPGSDFTSDADKAFFRTALTEFDCGIMGGRTYRCAREAIRAHPMSARLQIVLTHAPDRYVAESIPGRLEFTNATPRELVASLEERGIERCAIIGGAQIHSLFLAADLIDEFWLTIEPLLFGAGTPLLASPTRTALRLLEKSELSPDTLLLKYEPVR
jgi:dihydrofolate reductase